MKKNFNGIYGILYCYKWLRQSEPKHNSEPTPRSCLGDRKEIIAQD